MPPRALEPSRALPRRQAGGPVVLPGDRGDPSPDRRPHRPRRDARPVRDRAAARAVGRCDQARALARRPGQALRHRGRPDGAHVDRRSGGRGGRGVSRRPAAPSSRSDSTVSAARSSWRSRPRRRSRSAASAPTGCTGAGRRSRCRCGARTSSSLELLEYADGVARLDLRVGSGTYVRSIADALGGHCRTLRRLEVGPFSVDDADDERLVPPAEALPFLPAVEVDADEAAAIRAGRRRAQADVRTLCDGELVAVGRVVMPA